MMVMGEGSQAAVRARELLRDSELRGKLLVWVDDSPNSGGLGLSVFSFL